MTIKFYPYEESLSAVSVQEKLAILLDAAEQYKGAVLDITSDAAAKKGLTPRDIKIAFNWQEIAKILREVRDMQEGAPTLKKTKMECLTKLAEIYEVLRAAKMPKLDAVRMALVNEANHLR